MQTYKSYLKSVFNEVCFPLRYLDLAKVLVHTYKSYLKSVFDEVCFSLRYLQSAAGIKSS